MSSNAEIFELPQAVSWLALSFRVPEAWDIARHGIQFDRGSLVFVDRVRQCCSVSWTRAASEPDLPRLLLDFTNQPPSFGESVVERMSHAGFTVLSCRDAAGTSVLRALRFDPLSQRLIELELSTGATSDHALARALLASFAFGTPGKAKVRAFGLHAELPARFVLCKSRVRPADVTLEFERPSSSPERVSIRRSGMARAWFDGDTARALRTRRPDLRLDHCESIALGAHLAVVAQATSRRPIWPRAFGRSVQRRLTVWECPNQNALYETEVCLSQDNAADIAAVRVWCCAEHERRSAHGT